MKNFQIDEHEVNGKNNISNGKSNGTGEYIQKDDGDAVQQAMGFLGRWQILICTAISLIKFPVAWHQLAIVFMAPKQGYNCTMPSFMNSTDQCRAEVNGSIVECSEWKFDTSVFPKTIISQWDLVCSRDNYANVQQSILMFGILLGSVSFGYFSDRFGRKIPLMIAILLQLISGIGCAIVPWFSAFLFMKFISAVATAGTMVTSYVICMEIVGKNWRAAITILYQIPYSLGHMSLAGLAYWFRNWQHLQLAITLPSVVLLGYWWIVPESPRWLLAMGKQKAACKVLRSAAKFNKLDDKDIPDIVRQHCLHQKSKRTEFDGKPSILDLFRTPNMRMKSLSIFFNWTVCGMGLFGMSQYIGHVQGNIFINFAVSGIIQVPGNFVAWWTMNALGRRITLIISNLMTGVASFLIICVPAEMQWLKMIFACFGIVGMSVAFTTVYLYSGELFPTVVRNIGVGTSSMCARIGSMLAPFVVALAATQSWIPPVIFGVMPTIGAALCFLLPETAGCELPETLEDGENFGKKKKNIGEETDLNEAEMAF
ncbi:organic cation transporter protein isoform X1 [Trichogramma pretiosum]|uniref:organic cation transporter protein isoform X1 n=2 Tax=Trichogramma pretiosum TaxID=7493 RepID=UPI0006C96CE1|nr:organic cation transporter protein isoform X1 [Trichogramma pretiosum]XP_014226146.1 organic cation transporter protein isoform X1 [Trichogramma pretiosum]XP_014226147.1 organic cation transporter protein isoform X1 [Trichogramma pretiosum]XP_014226148.1 organic cation transporter protein isoform X1 [Trichogramma pretiosum]XP_023315863.1 organic cation transporter protein isoform X1 [Trichogramma pretiosum]